MLNTREVKPIREELYPRRLMGRDRPGPRWVDIPALARGKKPGGESLRRLVRPHPSIHRRVTVLLIPVAWGSSLVRQIVLAFPPRLEKVRDALSILRRETTPIINN